MRRMLGMTFITFFIDPTTTFLSCDWGTSAFRLRLVERELLKILAETHSKEGNAVGGVFQSSVRMTVLVRTVSPGRYRLRSPYRNA